MRALLLVVGVAFVIACGDDDGPGGSGAGGDAQGGEGPEGGQPGNGGGGAAAGGAPQGGNGTGGDGGQASGGIVPTISEGAFFGNCKPVIGPDPLNGSFTVSYDNTLANGAELEVTLAELLLEDADSSLTWRFEVDPSLSGEIPAMTAQDVVHTKVIDSGIGDRAEDPCDFCGAATGELTVTFSDYFGAVATETLAVEFLCAF